MRLSLLFALLTCLICTATWSAEPARPRVLALVRADLHAPLHDRLATWQADLHASGYQPLVETWPVDQLETRNDNAHVTAIWQRLGELHAQSASLDGVIFVGRFPSPVYRVDNWDGSTSYYRWLDDAFWYLDTFKAKPEGPGLQPDIWASRIDALDQQERAVHADQITLLRRYFDHLHAWRCGASRYPDIGYWALSGDFKDRTVYDAFYGEDSPLDTLWGHHIEELYAASDYVGKNMSNIFDTGGEYFIAAAHGFKSGNGTEVGGLSSFYSQPNQIRIYAIGSCNVNEIGGMCARSLFSRHGGTLFACANDLSPNSLFRASWNNGTSLGHIFVNTFGYPVQSYGDLTVTKTPACFTGNPLPTIDSFSAASDQVACGDSLSFSASASDADGIATYELFPYGYHDGAGAAVVMTDPNGHQHTYPVPHRYQPMLVVSDAYQASMWQTTAEVRVAPQPGRPLRINCGYHQGSRKTDGEYTDDDADYFDAAGHRWLYDQGYASGTWGRSGGGSTHFEDNGIAATTEDLLYQSFIRIDKVDQPCHYLVPLGDGSFDVRVHLAVADTGKVKNPGESLLDIDIEGTRVATALDVWAEAGDRRTALVQAFTDIAVTDGVLDLTFTRNAEASAPAAVNAIEILPHGQTETATLALRRGATDIAQGDEDTISDTRQGHAERVVYTLTNRGSVPLSCSGWSLSTDGCDAVLSDAPQTLLPLSSARLVLDITPTTASWSVAITASSNDPDAATVQWTAKGSASASPNHGVLSLHATAVNAVEGGFAALTIERTDGGDGAVAVRCRSLAGSAANDDFTAVDQVLSWADGETGRRLVRIPITDDAIGEDDETLTCELLAATGGATLGIDSATVTIIGNDHGGVIELLDSQIVVEEGQDVVLRLQRSGGDGAASIDIATSRGTAQHPDDFPHTIATISWPPGDQSIKSVTVSTVDDDTSERAEDFQLLAGRASAHTVIADARCEAIIDASDTPGGVLEFTATTISGSEGELLRVTLVRRDVSPEADSASAIARLTGRSAIKDEDFENALDAFPSWPAGEGGERYLDIPLLDDDAIEGPETFAISLPSISGCLPGAKNTVVVTILDTDDTGRRTVRLTVKPLAAPLQATCDESEAQTIDPATPEAAFTGLDHLADHILQLIGIPAANG